MNRIETWVDRDLLIRTIEALKAYAAIVRHDAERRDDRPCDLDAWAQAGRLGKDAEELSWLLNWQGEPKDTEDAQITAIKKLIEEHRITYCGRGNYAEAIRGIISHYEREKGEAYDAYASLVEEMRTNLRALQFMVHQFIEGATHRIKNSRGYVALDAIDTMVKGVMEIDCDNPSLYSTWGSHSWDFRRLQAENRELDRLVSDLKEENEKLKGQMPRVEPRMEEEILF